MCFNFFFLLVNFFNSLCNVILVRECWYFIIIFLIVDKNNNNYFYLVFPINFDDINVPFPGLFKTGSEKFRIPRESYTYTVTRRSNTPLPSQPSHVSLHSLRFPKLNTVSRGKWTKRREQQQREGPTTRNLRNSGHRSLPPATRNSSPASAPSSWRRFKKPGTGSPRSSTSSAPSSTRTSNPPQNSQTRNGAVSSSSSARSTKAWCFTRASSTYSVPRSPL